MSTKLGALWKKQGKNGEFFSGVVEINGVKTELTVFNNGYKTEQKHPDLIIYKSEPRQQPQQTETDIPM